jgi:hypothetical protein
MSAGVGVSNEGAKQRRTKGRKEKPSLSFAAIRFSVLCAFV